VRFRRRACRLSRYFENEHEAIAFRQQTENKLKRGERPDEPALRRQAQVAITVTEGIRLMLDAARDGTFHARTGAPYNAAAVRNYETAFRLYVVPVAGDWLLRDVTDRDVQCWIDVLSPITTQGNLEKVITVLNRLFEFAWRHHFCEIRNPTRGVLLRRDRTSPGRALTREEQRQVLHAAAAHDADERYSLMHPLVRILLGAGLRKGEAVSLLYDREQGLCLDEGRVTISRCMREVWTDKAEWAMRPGVVPGAKTKASAATVPLGADTVAALRVHAETVGAREGDLVFPDPVAGGLLARNRLKDAWNDVKGRANVGEPLRLYDLRHSFGSSLLAAGLNVAEVAQRMRHANPTVTTNTYLHAIREEPTDDWFDCWLARDD
jgi:integrase